VPQGEFRPGDLRELPMADSSVDLVVCTLALTHVPALDPVIREFARVLRPGGHLVIADMHEQSVARGYNPRLRGPNGRPARLVSYRHLVGDYLRAALAVGLQPRRCVEPRAASEQRPRTATIGPWEVWPWCLGDLVPEATQAANAGHPVMVIWDFQLAERPA
jgi:SAM-dependent methyltransferase